MLTYQACHSLTTSTYESFGLGPLHLSAAHKPEITRTITYKGKTCKQFHRFLQRDIQEVYCPSNMTVDSEHDLATSHNQGWATSFSSHVYVDLTHFSS